MIGSSTTLRYNEYYNMQSTFDKLYADSKDNKCFKRLYDIIISDNNIKLAYRNIKSNSGSHTKGTDNRTIKDIAIMKEEELIKLIKNKLTSYKPDKVRRVLIPKGNGKTRPLGIPTITDRIIQQCFKQVLEPICEAKFHDHSYGFRPNRSVENAIFRMQSFVNHANMHYCVDVDIKSFFDKINHGKLLKQIWSMGIRDKRVISIISKMLKAEIEGEGIPTEGTPQGGILSPLLANIVLNELDWWVSSQWETIKTKRVYVNNNQYRALKNTKLKEVFIVRYADDFKIFCRDYNTAEKMFIATKNWIKERLHLEISEEKSKITNLRKKYSEFLGFKLKAVKKIKYVKSDNNEMIRKEYFAVRSYMSDKARKNATLNLKKRIYKLQNELSHSAVGNLNSTILGMQNYYRIATHVSIDFNKIDFLFRRTLYNRLKYHIKVKPKEATSKLFKEKYESYKGIVYFLKDIAIFPPCCVKNVYPLAFKREICNYTDEGRRIIFDRLDNEVANKLMYLIKYPLRNESVELNDNRLSRFSMQKGKCAISRTPLNLKEFDVHHITPRVQGGGDDFKNLVCVNRIVHRLIHATDMVTIQELLKNLTLDSKSIEKLNMYRLKVGNSVI